MSKDLMFQGYNENQKSTSEIEKELTDKTKKQIESRTKAHQRIISDMSSGYVEDYNEKREIPRQTDPEKMSALQLISEGHRRLEDVRKAEEVKTKKK